MSTTWALTAEQIADNACWMLGLAPGGKAPQPWHRAKSLEILNGVLKQMPWYGYLWPKVASRYPFVIPAGDTAGIALPAGYSSSPVVKIFQDTLKAGFKKADSVSSAGDADTGQPIVVRPGNVLGISGGKGYFSTVIANGGFGIADCGKNGVVGLTLSTLGAWSTVLAFRGKDLQNILGFSATAANYMLIKEVNDVVSILKTYTSPVPVSGDKIMVRYNGSSIIPVVNGVDLEPYYSTLFLEETGVGVGAGDTLARFEDLFYSTGAEREIDLVTSGAWSEISNKMSLADLPTKGYISPSGRLYLSPSPNYFIRGTLQYAAKLDDLVAGAAPDMTSDFHPILSHMVADQLSFFVGRRALGISSKREWEEKLPLAIAAHNDTGDVFGDYDE